MSANRQRWPRHHLLVKFGEAIEFVRDPQNRHNRFVA